MGSSGWGVGRSASATMSLGRARAAVVVVVAVALTASVLAATPPAAGQHDGSPTPGAGLAVEITSPADGAGTDHGEVTLEGVVRLAGEGAVADTSVVVAIDNSNSTTSSAGVDCTGTARTDPAGHATSYRYDAVGNLTALIDPLGHTITYDYDPAGRLTELVEPSGSTSFAWSPDGRPESTVRPNQVTTSFAYDPAGRLVGVDHTGPDGAIDTFAYTLDETGNRTQVSSSAGTETYTLDALHRLVAVTYPDATAETFAYDSAGNRTTHTHSGGTTTYSYDPAGRLAVATSPGDTTSFEHDDAGNLIATSDGESFEWDSQGQLVGATTSEATQTYRYDPDGIRIGIDDADQLWDRISTSLPTLIDDGTATYTHSSRGLHTQTDADGTRWVHADALGSIRALSGADGATIGTATYQAFGEPLSTTGATSSFGFTGEHHDPTGLVHLRARHYSPSTGRFLSKDPVQPGGPGTGGYNPYTYAANNPTTWSDPTGRTVTAPPAPAPPKPPLPPGQPDRKRRCGGGGPIGEYSCLLLISTAVVTVGVVGHLVMQPVEEVQQSLEPTATLQPPPSSTPVPNPSPVPEPTVVPPPTTTRECDAPQTGGGGVTPVDLYAVGREGGPPFPRSSDLELDGDDVCPSAVDEDGFFRGLSTFASPQDLAANVSGQVWMLPAGTSLPDLAVVADGQNYNPRSPLPSSHHTMYPTRAMGYAETRARYQGLGWVHVGHTRDFQ